MMFKISILTLTLYVGCLYRVSGASYSKVYVQRGQEVLPVKYVQYGAPAVTVPAQQIAQISAAPVESVVPVASATNLITPCSAPCIYPGSAITSVAQLAPATPNLVTFKSNVPVVVEDSEEPTGYEYSYVVKDGDTGDYKAQHESSDGEVVRGQYSLIQPDGYIREVLYTADDLNGFNAIVKKFLPVKVERKPEHTDKDKQLPPCHEVQNESLKSSENHKKPKEADHTVPHYEDNHATAINDKSHEDKPSSEKPELVSSEESHETIIEHLHQPPNGTLAKPSEALIEASSESTEEKEPSEENTEKPDRTHKHTEHESEPQHEHITDPQGDHEKKQETETKMMEHEPKVNFPYHDIIKCVQNAINSKDQSPTPLTYIILNSPC